MTSVIEELIFNSNLRKIKLENRRLTQLFYLLNLSIERARKRQRDLRLSNILEITITLRIRIFMRCFAFGFLSA